MRISILLAIIIVVCAVCLLLLLYPKETTARTKQIARKRKAAPAPTSAQTPPRKDEVAEQTGEAKQTMSEMEAIRKAVKTFADEDPSTTARILKGWMKK